MKQIDVRFSASDMAEIKGMVGKNWSNTSVIRLSSLRPYMA